MKLYVLVTHTDKGQAAYFAFRQGRLIWTLSLKEAYKFTSAYAAKNMKKSLSGTGPIEIVPV